MYLRWNTQNFINRKSRHPGLRVNVSGVSVERLRHFGDIYLGLLLWSRLGLDSFCREILPTGRRDIPWPIMAAILVLTRFCAPLSELQIAEYWYDKTALDGLLGVPCDKINDNRLYRALDSLLLLLLIIKGAICHENKHYSTYSL